ncbi:MAG: anhydro-N-acetylmuramic acid kinase, partial [Gammaproteobacteria bacterium]|nr:anhydro-N-acetylmuramic acid kinase [Gammaproteobacteria bacterium]
MTDHYIGLMSGTSMDGIDAVIATFDDTGINIVATH